MKVTPRKLLILSAFCFSCLFLSAQTYQTANLKAAIGVLDRDRDMQGASWSLSVRDASTGSLIIDHFGSKTLPTASTMKVVTTATALASLGINYQFETKLTIRGQVRNGTLFGDLVIIGGSDPSLGSSRFSEENGLKKLMDTWTNQIKAAGIQKIEGRVIADVRTFGSQMIPGNWNWEDMGNYYGAGVSGLNINDNEYRIDFVPATRVGDKAELIRIDPYIPTLSFTSEVTTGKVGSGDNAYIFGAPYTYHRYIRGTIPAGKKSFSIRGSIPDPPLFTAQHLRQALIDCGVPVSGKGLSSRNLSVGDPIWQKPSNEIYVHKSLPLQEIIVPLNIKSINMYAEALSLKLASLSDKEAKLTSGAKTMKTFWSSRGVNTKGMLIVDGSGLSPNNSMKTNQLTAILAKAHQELYGPQLYNSLPVAGKSGSLAYMLRNTRAEGNMRAKSGYISGVRSYAGYVDAKNGRRLAFAIISYNYDCSPGAMRRKMEKVMAQVAEL